MTRFLLLLAATVSVFVKVDCGPPNAVDGGTFYRHLDDTFNFSCSDNVTPPAEHVEIYLWDVPKHDFENKVILYHTSNGLDSPIDSTLPQAPRLRVTRTSLSNGKNVWHVTLSSLKKSDFGKYGCNTAIFAKGDTPEGVHPGANIGKTIVLQLKEAVAAQDPVLSVPSLVENTAGSVTCSSSEGQPAPLFDWTFNGDPLNKIPGSFTNNTTRVDGGVSSSILSWSSVPRQLSGELRCIISGYSVIGGRSECMKTIVTQFGPDPMTGSLTSTTKLTSQGPSRYRLITAVDLDAGAVSCSEAQCQPSAACSYSWGSSADPLQLGRPRSEGIKNSTCTANHNVTKRTEAVAELSVLTHGPVRNLIETDVTARSVALSFELGFTGGLEHRVSAEWKPQTDAVWRRVQDITELTNSTLRLWLSEPGLAADVRVNSWIFEELQSKTTSKEYQVTLEALPTWSTNPKVKIQGRNATFTFSFNEGSPRLASVCASLSQEPDNCEVTKEYVITPPSRAKRSVGDHVVSLTNLPKSASSYWYQVSLEDGPDKLLSTDWIDGGEAEKEDPENKDFSLRAVAGGAAGGLLCIIVVVVVVVVQRRRKTSREKARQSGRSGKENGAPSQDKHFELSPGMSGYSDISRDQEESNTKDVTDQTPVIYTKPTPRKQDLYTKPKKSKSKDASQPLPAAHNDTAPIALYEDVGNPNGKQKKPQKKGKDQSKNKKTKNSSKAARAEGAEYSNVGMLPESEYSNVKKKQEQVYSNVNGPRSLGAVIVDSAKDHEDWKENQQGLVYADVQASRPALPSGQQQPIHAAPDNTTYAAVDFSRTGAAIF